MAKIKITLIQNDSEYRDVVKLAISCNDIMEVVGEFSTAEKALEELRFGISPFPDVILLGLNLAEMSGLEALPLLKAAKAGVKIIILSQSNQESDVLKSISLGAEGYLLRSATNAQIHNGIRDVIDGGAVLDPAVAMYVLQKFKAEEQERESETSLSPRELVILVLLSKGLVKKEISDELKISYSSVDTYVRRIYQKLDVRNAPSAVTKAFQIGLFLSSDY